MSKEEWKEVKSPWVKFGKVGDNIYGTLIGVREVMSQLPGKKGERVKVYEVKADGGIFHETDDKKNPVEPAIQIADGEIYNVGGGFIKLGQKIKIEFTEEKAPKQKGFSGMKIKKVYSNGKFDDEWLKEKEDQDALNQDFG
jgi:hypothetical protein